MSTYLMEDHQQYIDMVLVYLSLEQQDMGFWIQGGPDDEVWEIGFQQLTVGG